MSHGTAKFQLLTRADCHLCDEFQRAFHEWNSAGLNRSLEVMYIDDDVVLMRRYGLKVPVLLCEHEEIAFGHFDASAVERFLRTFQV
jgi:hypothetical protein